jgi:hypothetical protein
MKKSLLVTYDLHDKTKEQAVLTYIKKRQHTELTESTYMVLTSHTVKQFRDGMAREAGGKRNITCFVFRAKRPWAAAGEGEDYDDACAWLKANLVDD